jgi:hypothetical protein
MGHQTWLAGKYTAIYLTMTFPFRAECALTSGISDFARHMFHDTVGYHLI